MSDASIPAMSAPRRRPPAGGYARGDEKQARIVTVALHRFGEDGFEGASTRQIAAEAGVNPPALQYYFGGKEGLYLACGERIALRFAAAMEPFYRRAPDIVGTDTALDLLCDTMDAVADLLLETAADEGWAAFLSRSLNKDGDGPRNEVVGQKVEGDLNAHCVCLVGIILGRDPAEPTTILRTIAVTGQLTTFLFGQEASLRRLGWPDFRGPRLHMLKQVVRSHAAACLSSSPRG